MTLRMPAVDAAAVTRSIENPGHATVIGDDGARRAATHSIQNSQAVRSNDDVVNGDEAGNVRRARAGDGRGGGGDGRRDECGRRGAARRGARVDAKSRRRARRRDGEFEHGARTRTAAGE